MLWSSQPLRTESQPLDLRPAQFSLQDVVTVGAGDWTEHAHNPLHRRLSTDYMQLQQTMSGMHMQHNPQQQQQHQLQQQQQQQHGQHLSHQMLHGGGGSSNGAAPLEHIAPLNMHTAAYQHHHHHQHLQQHHHHQHQANGNTLNTGSTGNNHHHHHHHHHPHHNNHHQAQANGRPLSVGSTTRSSTQSPRGAYASCPSISSTASGSSGASTTGSAASNDKIGDDLLTSLTVRELNKRLHGCPREEVVRLKQKRRTLKNRGYAQNCRSKRLQQRHELERTNRALMAELTKIREQLSHVQKERDQLKQRLLGGVSGGGGGGMLAGGGGINQQQQTAQQQQQQQQAQQRTQAAMQAGQTQDLHSDGQSSPEVYL